MTLTEWQSTCPPNEGKEVELNSFPGHNLYRGSVIITLYQVYQKQKMCFVTKDCISGRRRGGGMVVWNGKLTSALHCKQVPCVDSLSLKEKKKTGEDHSKVHSYHYKRNATGNVFI